MNISNSWLQGDKRSTALGLILFLALALYANTLLNGFVYDDHFQVEQNPYVHSTKYIGTILTTTVWSFQGLEGKTNYYRPLMTLSFLVCNKVFQAFPAGFHVINVLLNCVVVWLVFLTLSILVLDETAALLAAAIFALHPIHTEVVAWIASITELELAIFYLAAFIFFLRSGSSPPRKRTAITILMCACFVLALLSKEQAMTLALLATIYEHLYRSDRSTTSWKTKASRYAGFWIIAAAYFVFRITVLGGLAPVRQHADVTWPQAFLSAFALVAQYIAKLFWPHPLLAFYVFHKSSGLTDLRVLTGIGVTVLAILLFAYLWKRARIYSFLLIWIAITLLPVLNARWMATNVFTERYLYLPSVGFCALLAGAVVCSFRGLAGTPRLRWALTAVAIILGALAAGEIVARNPDWHDDLALVTRTLAVEPHASYMRTDLGVLEWNQRREGQAEADWRQALTDMPDNAVALSNLGMAVLQKQQYDEAERYLQQAIALRPRFASPHTHLGELYAAKGDKTQAEAEMRRAVEIHPMSMEARNALGKFYYQSGNLAGAEEQYRASVDSSPNADAWDGLGDVYARESSFDKAERAWLEAVRLSTYDSHAHVSLGNLYFATGRQQQAEKEFRIVLLLDPNDADAVQAMRKLRPAEFPAAQR
jgi:Flp pilus assembly protein TadD